MKRRLAVRVIAYLGAAAIVFCALYTLKKRDADAAERALRYRGEQAFAELCDSVGAMDAALRKTLYSVSPGVTASLCAEVWSRAQSADHALSSLTFPVQELEQTASFLATTGDYAAYLLRRTGGGAEVSEDERENLRSLSEGAALLSENLRQLRADLADGLVSADAVRAAEAGLTALPDSFRQMEQEFPEIPTLVYDGPFSTDRTERAPRMASGGTEIESEAAMLVTAGFLGVRSNQTALEGREEGRIPVWRIRAGDYTVCVSRRGGHVVRAISDRTPTRTVLSVADALKAARKTMDARRYSQMLESYHMVEGNVLTVTFCAGQNGVICYPDMVKISVAMDTGKLLRYDAGEYLTCHTRRELPPAQLTEEEAAARVPAGLRLLAQRLAVIPSAGAEEIFCRELVCEDAAGQHLLIYLNALTGAQERILLLLEDETGTLAL